MNIMKKMLGVLVGISNLVDELLGDRDPGLWTSFALTVLWVGAMFLTLDTWFWTVGFHGTAYGMIDMAMLWAITVLGVAGGVIIHGLVRKAILWDQENFHAEHGYYRDGIKKL